MPKRVCHRRYDQPSWNRSHKKIDDVVNCREDKDPKKYSRIAAELPPRSRDDRTPSKGQVVGAKENRGNVDEQCVIH